MTFLVNDVGMNDFSALHFLLEVLEIDSQTRNISGVNMVQDLVAKNLNDLGFTITRYPHPEKKFGDLLVATKLLEEYYPWINFIGHSDTVQSSFPVEKGPTIWKGSGIADNKGGVVTIIQTLFNLRDQNLPYNFRIVISPNEEVGSPGFQELFREWGAFSTFNLGFEPALEKNELIVSRNGNCWYEVKMSSTAAHAGRASKGRLNLIHRVSDVIYALEMAVQNDPYLKFNVTSIQTENQKFNVIPDQVTFRIDARFNSFSGKNFFYSKLIEVLQKAKRECDLTGTKVELSFTTEDDCPPMSANDSHFLKMIDLPTAHSGGAADINYFSTPTNTSIDGWGARGGGLHSKQEWLDTNSIFERASILSDWLTALNYNSRRVHFECSQLPSEQA